MEDPKYFYVWISGRGWRGMSRYKFHEIALSDDVLLISKLFTSRVKISFWIGEKILINDEGD